MGSYTLLKPDKVIILFDTTCLLCNKTVQFLLKVDIHKKILFAGLSSEFGKSIIEEHHMLDDSVIMYYKGNYKTKSSAFLAICKHLGFPYSIFLILYIIPPFIRDWVYALISKHRYRWFGTTDCCLVDSDRIIL